MGVLSWIVLGLIVGVLAKWLMPGKDPGGLIVTVGIGIAGAFIGGYLATHFGVGSVDGINIKSILIATGGGMVLLGLYRLIKK